MKILYLYAEVMGYTMATIKELVKHGNEVHVICWVDKKKTSYQTAAMSGVTFYARESYTSNELHSLTASINPSITVVSGWMDQGYLSVAAGLRRQRKIVVCGLDSQWNRSVRQMLSSTLGSFHYL